METHKHSIGRSAAMLAMIAAGLMTQFSATARADEDLWPSLQRDVFGSRPINENDGIVTLDAPQRATPGLHRHPAERQ